MDVVGRPLLIRSTQQLTRRAVGDERTIERMLIVRSRACGAHSAGASSIDQVDWVVARTPLTWRRRHGFSDEDDHGSRRDPTLGGAARRKAGHCPRHGRTGGRPAHRLPRRRRRGPLTTYRLEYLVPKVRLREAGVPLPGAQGQRRRLHVLQGRVAGLTEGLSWRRRRDATAVAAAGPARCDRRDG